MNASTGAPVAEPSPLWRKWWLYVLLLLAVVLGVFAVFRVAPGASTAPGDLAIFVDSGRRGDLSAVRLNSDGRHFTYQLAGDSTWYETQKPEAVSIGELLHYGANLSADEIKAIDIRDDPGLAGRITGVALDFLPAAGVIGFLLVLLWLSGRRTHPSARLSGA